MLVNQRMLRKWIILAVLGIVISAGTLFSNFALAEESSIPSWIKTISGFWADDQISDDEYLSTIAWLIDNGILKVTQSETEISQSQTKSYEDKGDFYAVYSPASDKILQAAKNDAENGKKLDVQADMYNEIFKLPYDVPLNFSECGYVNAYYDPKAKEITFCYELMADLAGQFLQVYDPSSASIAVNSVLLFVGYHEVGHALIDIYNLPTTGMEEDAVDQLATLILLDDWSLFSDAILGNTAVWFSMGSHSSNSGDLTFWDEHSLNQQRFYNILCWAYGSDTERFSYLVSEGYLHELRAVKCTSEYEQMSKSWDVLLSSYVK